MNRFRANDFGRRPGPFGIRRVDNEDLQTQDHVASIAGNHPVVVASFSTVADIVDRFAASPPLGRFWRA
jgi:hypothetical protein